MRGYVLGLLALNLLTLIWGTTFVVVKGAVEGMAPSLLILLRFGVAALFFLPWLFRLPAGAFGPGMELAFWLFVGYASQTLGLAHTSASRSAFITALSVVLVPLLLRLAGREVGPAFLAAFLALAGVGLLSYDPYQPPFNVGDLWTFLTALAYALYIVRPEVHARAFPPSPSPPSRSWARRFSPSLGSWPRERPGGRWPGGRSSTWAWWPPPSPPGSRPGGRGTSPHPRRPSSTPWSPSGPPSSPTSPWGSA